MNTIKLNFDSLTTVTPEVIDKLKICIADSTNNNYNLSWSGHIEDYNTLKAKITELETKINSDVYFNEIKGLPEKSGALLEFVRREINSSHIGFVTRTDLNALRADITTTIDNKISDYDKKLKEFLADSYANKTEVQLYVTNALETASSKYFTKESAELLNISLNNKINQLAVTKLSQLINDVGAVSATLNHEKDTLVINEI